MKNSFSFDLQRFMLIPTKFPLSHHPDESGAWHPRNIKKNLLNPRDPRGIKQTL